MIDYKYKSYVIELGIPDIVKYLSQYEYAEYLKMIKSPQLFVPKFTKKEYDYYLNELQTFYPKEYEEGKKINHATSQRAFRLRKKISLYIQNHTCLFLTLTFNNICFEKTSADTRKKYVKNYLKSLSDLYIANIDYGSEKGREHYHSIVAIDRIDIKKQKWKYGNLNFEKIIVSDKSSKKLSKYISKLTNHAIKDTTCGNRVIYSRKKF